MSVSDTGGSGLKTNIHRRKMVNVLCHLRSYCPKYRDLGLGYSLPKNVYGAQNNTSV